MSRSFFDPFERLATECGLHVVIEEAYSAPRDILCPPADTEQCFLVTLRAEPTETRSLRFAYFAPLTQTDPPATRDVLWWLASDAWAIEQAGGDENTWAELHGYPPHDAGTTRLFERHTRLAEELRALFGVPGYEGLIELYAQQVSSSKPCSNKVSRPH